MKRDVYKFLCGMVAGFAIEHAMIAVFTSGELHYFGRDWDPSWGWLGAVLYSAISLWLGYLGWRPAKSPTSTGSLSARSNT